MANRPVRPIFVTGEQIDTSDPSQVAIANAALVEGLIQNQETALDLLGEIGPVDLGAISVDDRGRILVADEAFVEGIEERASLAKKPKPTDPKPFNWICGAICQL